MSTGNQNPRPSGRGAIKKYLHKASILCDSTDMEHDISHLILEHLRAIRADIATIKEDVSEIKYRVSILEVTQASILSNQAHSQASHDRVVSRVERIERRLEIGAST